MKIYGGNIDGVHRVIVAADSKKEAAMICKCSLYNFSNYFCSTGNDEEIALAMSKPKTAFMCVDDHRTYDWHEVK